MVDPDSEEYLQSRFDEAYQDLDSRISAESFSIEVASILFRAILDEIHFLVEEEAYEFAGKIYLLIAEFGSRMFSFSKESRTAKDFELSNQFWDLFVQANLVQSVFILGKNIT